MTSYRDERSFDVGYYDEPLPTTDDSGLTKEFQADFTSPENKFNNSSLTRRPDAISLDYLHSFTLGPIALRNPAAGILYRPWRCWTDNGHHVYTSRSNADNDDWEPEVELFNAHTWAPVEILELDIAFTQNADPVVCCECDDGHLWIYYYNSAPGHGQFEFNDFGLGKSPRAVLDDPFDVTNSDVQIFYITGAGLKYLQQRERYTVIHNTPIVDVSGIYVEDAFRDNSLRLHVVLSKRNTVTGRYSLELLSSLLFPLPTIHDSLSYDSSTQSGELREVFIYGYTNPEGIDIDFSAVGGSITIPVIIVDAEGEIATEIDFTLIGCISIIIIGYTNPEGINVDVVVQSGELRLIIITGYTAPEGMDADVVVQSGTLRDILIGYTAAEGMNADIVVQSGSLV